MSLESVRDLCTPIPLINFDFLYLPPHCSIMGSVNSGIDRITLVSCTEIPVSSLYEEESLADSNIQFYFHFSFLLLINDALCSSEMCSASIIVCIILHFLHNSMLLHNNVLVHFPTLCTRERKSSEMAGNLTSVYSLTLHLGKIPQRYANRQQAKHNKENQGRKKIYTPAKQICSFRCLPVTLLLCLWAVNCM